MKKILLLAVTVLTALSITFGPAVSFEESAALDMQTSGKKLEDLPVVH